MAALSFSWTIGIGLPALAVQTVAVATSRALRVYSRSRLEAVCESHGRADRADKIAKDDERTERAAESLAVLSGLTIAVLAGANAVQFEHSTAEKVAVIAMLAIAAIDYVASGAFGRVFAERLLDRLWPLAPLIRALATPLTLIAAAAEWIAETIWGRDDDSPRPASVEVEIPPDEYNPESDEIELPEATRKMLERVVELARTDVSEVMVPRSSMVVRPATIGAQEAAEAFRSTGLSRIPLFGENRDDVIGVLYAKDLFPAFLDAADPRSVVPRKLVRPAYLVPETKMASELLEELRKERLQIAIVFDEYGGVSGLITLENLIEELVGPIDDEHDLPPLDRVRKLGGSSYEVDATLGLDDLNDRLKLRLPTDDDVKTVAGLAILALGRLPEPGATFRQDGVNFTVLEVSDHSIRRMRLDLLAAP